MIFLNDEDKVTRHTYHDIRFLPLGRRSAITIGHEMVLHIVSLRQSRRSSSLALYNHREHHWKRGTRVLAACKIVTANQSKPGGRSDCRTTAATVFDNRVDVVTFGMLLWLSLSVLRWVGAPMLSSIRGWCALRLSLTAYHTAKCFLRRVIHTLRQQLVVI